jgi:hypothetical protein
MFGILFGFLNEQPAVQPDIVLVSVIRIIKKNSCFFIWADLKLPFSGLYELRLVVVVFIDAESFEIVFSGNIGQPVIETGWLKYLKYNP